MSQPQWARQGLDPASAPPDAPPSEFVGETSLAGAARGPLPSPPPRGFWISATIFGFFLAAASAPSPLYSIYATMWGFSTTTLTLVFGVYAVALLAGLLLLGTLSDAIGRKPVIVTSLLLATVSLVLFIVADGVVLLVLARIGQGFSTGLATAAVSAALLDQQPAARPGLAALVNAAGSAGGLAFGALLSGALVHYGPYPTRLVYGVLAIVALLLAVATVVRMTETIEHTARPRLAVRIGVSSRLRRPFLAALPCLVATWGLSAFYLSLGPSLAQTLARSDNSLIGGVAIALLTGAAALASVAARRVTARTCILSGCALLALGSIVICAALVLHSPITFYLSTFVAGVGFGAGWLGALRTLVDLAGPDERSSLVAAIYTVAYLTFSLPAVLAGELATHVGLQPTSVGYSIAVAILALAALAANALPLTAHPAPRL